MSDYTENLYLLAFSGKGTPLIDRSVLLEIISVAKSRRAIIDALEVFRIEGSYQIPCVEYGIFGGELDSTIDKLEKIGQIEYMENEVKRTFDLLDKEGGEYKFMVWLANVDD